MRMRSSWWTWPRWSPTRWPLPARAGRTRRPGRGVTIDVRAEAVGPLPVLGRGGRPARDRRQSDPERGRRDAGRRQLLLRGEAREGRAILTCRTAVSGWRRRSRRGSSSRSSRPRAAAERAWGWRSCARWSPGTAARSASRAWSGAGRRSRWSCRSRTRHRGRRRLARGRAASRGRGRRRCRARRAGDPAGGRRSGVPRHLRSSAGARRSAGGGGG